jgi:hypothetical protein
MKIPPNKRDEYIKEETFLTSLLFLYIFLTQPLYKKNKKKMSKDGITNILTW